MSQTNLIPALQKIVTSLEMGAPFEGRRYYWGGINSNNVNSKASPGSELMRALDQYLREKSGVRLGKKKGQVNFTKAKPFLFGYAIAFYEYYKLNEPNDDPFWMKTPAGEDEVTKEEARLAGAKDGLRALSFPFNQKEKELDAYLKAIAGLS